MFLKKDNLDILSGLSLVKERKIHLVINGPMNE